MGAEAFIDEPERLIIYECDALALEKFIPHAVVLPANGEEVIAVVRCHHTHGIPIISRRAGTSLSGNVLGLECILPNGEAIWLGADMDSGDDTARLDLRGLLIGSDGVFGFVTRALVRLLP